MSSVIDETKYPIYTLDPDPLMEKKKCGTYSIREILEAIKILNGPKKNDTFSIKEILEAVEALNEQN